MFTNQQEILKPTMELLDRCELEFDSTKELLIKLHNTTGQYQFSFQLNDIFKKAFQYKRVKTVQNLIDALCVLSLELTFDAAQIIWLECFKFLSQLSNIGICLKTVMKMLDQSIYLPEATMNFILEKLIEGRQNEESLQVLSKLRDHGRISKLNHKEILKNYLFYDQSEYAFKFLELLPLEYSSTLYVWEDYLQYCGNKDKVKEARVLMKSFFTQILPQNKNEAGTIYSTFLANLCKRDAIKETLLATIDDIVEFKLTVKPSVLKDSLLKLLDEKVDQKDFYMKVDLVKFNLEGREFAALLNRLIQLKRKVEVLALVDMIVSESKFTFTLADLSLSNQDMKYILAAQSKSIRYLLDEKEKYEAELDEKSDATSILDRLTFDGDDDFEKDFEKIY